MQHLDLVKTDGRRMTLYSRRAIPVGIEAPSPNRAPIDAQPHLRWHPLRQEWVSYASHRQERTFLPPPEYNPLAPMRSAEIPTEMPEGDYDAAAFQNLFPSLAMSARPSAEWADLGVPTEPAHGECEVVVFTQSPGASLGSLPTDHVELILDIWADRTERLARNPAIRYVMPFENRGVEMGVTLHHPHGQIYAYPFIPPVAARELEAQRAHFAREGTSLLESLARNEERDGRRVIFGGEHALAFVPVCARYPYETWVLPRRPARWLSELRSEERHDLARALKTTLLKYDGLWKRPFPYLLVFHQAPVNGDPVGAHLHFEIYPALRAPGRLKYLAGTELGAGMFANDTLPEQKAAELRAVEVTLD